MSLNAAALKLMAEKGLSIGDVIEIAEAMEARSKGAERQQRYRARERNKRDVTGDVTPPLNEVSNPPPPSETEVSSGGVSPRKSSKGSRLPNEFAVPNEWIDWAVERRHWARAEAVAESEKFCRHWQTKTGRDATKLDWFKTWQNWVDGSFRPNGTNTASGQPFDQAEYEARLAKIGQRESTGPPRPIGEIAKRVASEATH